MGMDVYGTEPIDPKGEYFRNNVWWWRPLWDYCITHHPDPAAKVENGHSNDGDGLNATDATKLGTLLKQDILSGKVDSYEEKYKQELESLPMAKCEHCSGTGIRNDEYVQGTCNACQGEGKVKHWAASYPFNKENVQEFSEFLVNSGGFSIC
jgi:hypothetical protein